MSVGGYWAEMFDKSLAREMSKLTHFNLGNQQFKLTDDMSEALDIFPDEKAWREYQTRMNSPSRQASEIIWRFTEYVKLSALVLLDNALLDTAIGQYVMMTAKQDGNCPVWAVGTDDKTSPLAPAYLKGIVYPSTPDDLVKLCLREMDRERNPSRYFRLG